MEIEQTTPPASRMSFSSWVECTRVFLHVLDKIYVIVTSDVPSPDVCFDTYLVIDLVYLTAALDDTWWQCIELHPQVVCCKPFICVITLTLHITLTHTLSLTTHSSHHPTITTPPPPHTALKNLPHLVKTRTFSVATKESLMAKADKTGNLKRVLGPFDVIMVGVGIILGSGIYVVTGEVAQSTTGPAVVLSYVLAGISAMLSGLCYAELAVDLPIAGGSYAYVLTIFGELMAWCVFWGGMGGVLGGAYGVCVKVKR